MAVKNTRTIITTAPAGQVHDAIIAALHTSEVTIDDPGNPILASSKRAMLKNRWAATHSIEVQDGRVNWTIDGFGDKHDAIRDAILTHVPDTMIDDQGVNEAIAAMGKPGRIFGFMEVARLRTVITPAERVLVIATGVMGNSTGVIMLTTERVVFFDKGFKSSAVEEFSLLAIHSMGFKKILTGEEVNISMTGREATINSMQPGRGQAFVDQFRTAQQAFLHARNSPTPPAPATEPDALDQLRKLGELRDAGVLSETEFDEKKQKLLGEV